MIFNSLVTLPTRGFSLMKKIPEFILCWLHRNRSPLLSLSLYIKAKKFQDCLKYFRIG